MPLQGQLKGKWGLGKERQREEGKRREKKAGGQERRQSVASQIPIHLPLSSLWYRSQTPAHFSLVTWLSLAGPCGATALSRPSLPSSGMLFFWHGGSSFGLPKLCGKFLCNPVGSLMDQFWPHLCKVSSVPSCCVFLGQPCLLQRGPNLLGLGWRAPTKFLIFSSVLLSLERVPALCICYFGTLHNPLSCLLVVNHLPCLYYWVEFLSPDWTLTDTWELGTKRSRGKDKERQRTARFWSRFITL